MAAFLLTVSAMFALVRELALLMRQPKYRALVVWLALLLVMGAAFYHVVEGWSWLDAFYFCVITLATVGYGDLSPTTPEAKLFTIVYLFLGLSVFITIVSLLVKEREALRYERTGTLPGDSDQSNEDPIL
jgi:voltage-gated potassium channel